MNYRIERNLIIMKVAGTYSVDDLLEITRTALDDPKATIPARILLDAADSKVIRNTAEIMRVASTVSSWRAEIEKIAVYVTSEVQYGAMRMGMAFSTFSSFDVSPFRSYDEAMKFLNEN